MGIEGAVAIGEVGGERLKFEGFEAGAVDAREIEGGAIVVGGVERGGIEIVIFEAGGAELRLPAAEKEISTGEIIAESTVELFKVWFIAK